MSLSRQKKRTEPLVLGGDGKDSESKTEKAVAVCDADGVLLARLADFMGCSTLGPSLGHRSHLLWVVYGQRLHFTSNVSFKVCVPRKLGIKPRDSTGAELNRPPQNSRSRKGCAYDVSEIKNCLVS